MNKKFHTNNIMLIIIILLIIVSSCTGLSIFVGKKSCTLQGEYVGLKYSYLGHWETGASCSVYYNSRWISSMTYYEYNNIHLPRK